MFNPEPEANDSSKVMPGVEDQYMKKKRLDLERETRENLERMKKQQAEAERIMAEARKKEAELKLEREELER